MPPEHLGTILAIDDESDVVDIVSDHFTSLGYHVVGAGHGGDGLMLAEFDRPDVVLLDITMPGISGVEVLQQLRLRWPELPVIMVTGLGDPDIAKDTLRRGAFDYIAKPFELDRLERVVAAAVSVGNVVA